MKKELMTLLLSALTFSAPVLAGDSMMHKGDLAFNLDWNLGSSRWIHDCTNGGSLLAEYAFMNVINEKGCISAGLLFGVGAHTYGDENFMRIRVGTRGTLHYSFIPQLDTYAGLDFCFVDIERFKWKNSEGMTGKNRDTKFVPPFPVVGIRYMFAKAFGVNLEAGADRLAHLAVGLTFKF